MEVLSKQNIERLIKSINSKIEIDEEIYNLISKLFEPTFKELNSAQNISELISKINSFLMYDRPMLIPMFTKIISESTLEMSKKLIFEYLLNYVLEQAIEITIGNTPLNKVPELSVDDIYMSLFISFDKNVLKIMRTNTELPPREIILSKHNSPNPVQDNSTIRLILKKIYPGKIISEDGIYFIQNLVIYFGYKYLTANERIKFLDSLPNNVKFENLSKNNPLLQHRLEFQIIDLVISNISTKTISSTQILDSILHNKFYNFTLHF